jgi:C-terminal processing protease CtpA/Prc
MRWGLPGVRVGRRSPGRVGNGVAMRSLLLLLALAAALPAGLGAQESRELQRLEAEREALERAREALERTRERLEEMLQERGDSPPRIRLEALRGGDLADRMARVQILAARPRLGVSLRGDQEEEVTRQGARIEAVMDEGPADRAGLQEGDIITALDGVSVLEPLADPGQERSARREEAIPVGRVLALARALEPGDSVRLEYLRDGVPGAAIVVVDDGWGEMPWRSPGGMAWSFPREGDRAFRLEGLARELPRIRAFAGMGACGFPGTSGAGCVQGIQLVELNPSLGEYFGADRGVLVVEVVEVSSLALRAGDVILRIGDREVNDPADVRRILGSYRSGEEVELHILRQGQETAIRGRVD